MTRTVRNTLLAGGATLPALGRRSRSRARNRSVRPQHSFRSGCTVSGVETVQSGEDGRCGAAPEAGARSVFAAAPGYANQNYLAMAGGDGPAMRRSRGLCRSGLRLRRYAGYAYNDDYYDDYEPERRLLVSPRFVISATRLEWPMEWRQSRGRQLAGPSWLNGGNRIGGVARRSRVG